VHILATDASTDARQLALENVVGHGVADMVEVRSGDLLAERGGLGDDLPVDVIVANLPYVPTEDVPRLPVAASFEPRMALDGGADGLDLVRRLIELLPDVLAPDGTALLEIGADQGEAAAAEARVRSPDWDVRVEPDLAGRPRVLVVSRHG
jgi:release factor glutamine methyltransferase